MSAIFKSLYELGTSPLGLPINFFYEYLILGVIEVISYGIAYRKVGDMYFRGIINGKTAGSFFHWIIRAFLFVIMWAITFGAIKGYYFITSNWQLSLMIVGSITGTASICKIAVSTMRLIKKHRTVNDNA